jgi:hypothetical protein
LHIYTPIYFSNYVTAPLRAPWQKKASSTKPLRTRLSFFQLVIEVNFFTAVPTKTHAFYFLAAREIGSCFKKQKISIAVSYLTPVFSVNNLNWYKAFVCLTFYQMLQLTGPVPTALPRDDLWTPSIFV